MKSKFILLPTLLLILTACNAPVVTPTQTQAPAATATAAFTATPAPTATPAFDAAKYGGSELDISYCEPHDPLQTLDVYYPNEGGPWPVMLYVHGGSWYEGDKAEGEGWRGLNDLGYLVVPVNYRMAPLVKFPDMIGDLKCAVRYLRAHASEYNIDVNRIAALGASAGGHLVSVMGTTDESAGFDGGEYLDQSSRVQAVVAMAAITDLTQNLPSGIRMPIYSAFGKLPGTPSPQIVDGSPVTYITADDPPFLIFHGDNDGVVPYQQSEILQAALTAAGVDSRLVIVKNGDHGLAGKDATPTQDEIYEMIVAFLGERLK
jgi:acetyl esterase/lipase